MSVSGNISATFRARFGTEPDCTLEAFDEDSLCRMAGRRSVRAFDGRAIPEGLLNSILLATQSAPSKSDLQQYSIIVLRDKERRRQLAEIAGGKPWIAAASVILVFCGDLHRIRRISETHDLDYANNNLDSFMNAAVDAGIALATCVQAAEIQGLGTCPLSILRNRIDETSNLLGLPDQVFPLAGLGIGFPSENPKVSPRLPPGLVRHDETYSDDDFDERIDHYDRLRGPIPPEKQRHRQIFGTDPELTWSGNAARQMSQPEREHFRKWLASRGIEVE